MKKGIDQAAFGRKLNMIRSERQLTSEQLSERCGITAVFLRQIESANRLPSLPLFVSLCNELQVSPNFLLSDSITWDEGDEIATLNSRLRALSPHQYDTVMGTVNLLIAKMMEPEIKDSPDRK